MPQPARVRTVLVLVNTLPQAPLTSTLITGIAMPLPSPLNSFPLHHVLYLVHPRFTDMGLQGTDGQGFSLLSGDFSSLLLKISRCK